MGETKVHSTKSWKSYRSTLKEEVITTSWISRFFIEYLIFINKSFYKVLAIIIVFVPNLIVLYIVNLIFLVVLGLMRPFI